MRWHNLLFIHWPIDPAVLRPLIPAGLELDTFDGSAWIAVVPFTMTGIRHRFLPPLPWVSAFAELNVRTYVTANDRPGVWFFSLDAANPLAVRVARRTFHLRYYDASMSAIAAGDEIRYRCTRTHRGAPPAEFSARYRPIGPITPSANGSLEEFFTERYSLYAADSSGRLYRGDIDHVRWPLQLAQAEIDRNTMTEQLQVCLPETKPLLHFAKRLEVVVWTLTPVLSQSPVTSSP
jgi:hypothetical protein